MNRLEVLENPKTRHYFYKNKNEEDGPVFRPREDRQNTYKQIVEELIKHFNINDSITITDVGGGIGYLKEIIPSKWKYTNITLRKSEAEENKKSGIKCVNADILDLPLEEGEFNCVVSVLTLSYITDQIHGLFEMCRILKKNGILISGYNLIPDNKKEGHFNILNREGLNLFLKRFKCNILHEFIIREDTGIEILITIAQKTEELLK